MFWRPLGLAVILQLVPTLFLVIKIVGACYLVWLGIAIIRSGPTSTELPAIERRNARRAFVHSMLVEILNPKTALFFLAFLPQFVDPGVGSAGQQILLLGLIYAALALITDGTYALLAGALRHLVQGRIMQGKWPSYITGSLYIGLGLNAAFSGRKL